MLIAQMSKVKILCRQTNFDVEDFKLYKNDRVGIVGLNGSEQNHFSEYPYKHIPDEGTASVFVNYSI